MPHQSLEHTADSGLEATAASQTELIEELAAGMFELMADPGPCPGGMGVTACVEAPTFEDLVVDTLSELLYLAETEDLHLCDFEVTSFEDHSIRLVAHGIPTADVEMDGPTIKAVTYHRLVVTDTGDGWYARVYFDV